MTNSDDFAFVFSTKSIKYKFKEFQKLLPVERAKAFKDLETVVLAKAVFLSVYDDLRKQPLH
jgi:hypothetical protein